MTWMFPVEFDGQEADCVVAIVPDIPGAEAVASTKAAALKEVTEAVINALNDHFMRGPIKSGLGIPTPSCAKSGQPVVVFPVLVEAKLLLYTALKKADLTRTDLANRLEISECAVRRLLDLRQKSLIGNIEAALANLEYRLDMKVRNT